MTTVSHNIEPASKAYVSQGLKLHYLDWGNESAPPLLLVHGMRDHARSWDWVARALRNEWHVITPDLRGHGDSEWSADGAYLIAYYLLDFTRLIDELGHEQVSVVAHSLGGNPAARFAALFPQRIRKMVLVDAMGPTAPVIARWNELGVVKRTHEWLDKVCETVGTKPRCYATIEEGMARMVAANKRLSAEQARHLTIHGMRRVEGGYSWKYDPIVGNFTPEDFAIDLADFWSKVTAPTLICWGTESWTTNPATDGRSVYFRDHRNLTFENAGHWIHHDQLEKFVGALRGFL